MIDDLKNRNKFAKDRILEINIEVKMTQHFHRPNSNIPEFKCEINLG